MNNFEKITASPEAMGEFLESLAVASGPWDREFHKAFCRACGKDDCETCPHKKERNNPLWWLMLETELEEVADADEFKTPDGKCMDFNVYLGRKSQGGIPLRGVEKVIFPVVCTHAVFPPTRAELKLIFRSMEYADDVIRALGEMCTIEIRAAVMNFYPSFKLEFHGNHYILEAAPKEIIAEPLTKGGGAGVEVRFQVRRFTANDTDDSERWSIEWTGQEAKAGKYVSPATGVISSGYSITCPLFAGGNIDRFPAPFH